MKSYPNFIVIREIKSKMTVKYFSHKMGEAKKKKSSVMSGINETVKKWLVSCTAGGGINWYSILETTDSIC